MAEHVREKLKEIFENTIESDSKFEGDFEKPDYYALFCKAAARENFYKLMGANLCMFNCKYEDKDAVMMVFSIPINDESGAKNVAERVMEIARETEKCFITLDFINSAEVREDRFIYVTAVKIIDGG